MFHYLPNNTSIHDIRKFLLRSYSLRKLNINKFTFFISSLLFPEHHLKSLQIKQNHLCLLGQIQPGNHFPGEGLATSGRCLRVSASSITFTDAHTGLAVIGTGGRRTGPKDWITPCQRRICQWKLRPGYKNWKEESIFFSFQHFQKQENSY